MLSKKIEAALNAHIPSEGYASSSYLSMASWCETKGLRGASAFFYQQSAEEREHMLKIVRYINSSGGYAQVPAIKGPETAYQSLKQILEISLRQEQDVTEAINKLVDQAFTAKDYTTFNFLQWFLTEQHEEENLFKSLLDILGISGKDGILLVDNEIGKIRSIAGKE